MTTARRLVFAGAAVVVTAACTQPGPEVLVERARDVTAMASFEEGLYYGERKPGRILDLDGEVVARVDVSSDGQRGLLGLAVDDAGTIFASWTRPDLRLVVAAVAPGRQRIVWLGPRSTDLATGGHIAFDPDDGSLVVGIGDLQDPGAVSDPKAPNGKLLRLDPDGDPDQRPKTISYGWNNPYAFDFGDDGALWLADNAPGAQEERLLRADPVGPRAVLPERTAPSGLAVVDDDTLVVCGYRTKLLLRYSVGANQTPRPDGTLARDCRLGVVALDDGRVAYATDTAIKTLRP